MRLKDGSARSAIRRDPIDSIERAAEADIETSRKVLDHNRQVLVNQDRLMGWRAGS